MHCFFKPMPPVCCRRGMFGFPLMFSGRCCGGRNAFNFGAGMALGFGAAGILGAVINRYC